MDEMRFCEQCGGELYQGRCMKCGRVYQVQTNEPISFGNRTEEKDGSRYNKIFMKKDEKFIYALGNNYLETFLSTGALGTGFAVISDKRVYFKGRMFNLGDGKALVMSQASKVVDLKDITGSSIMSTFKPWMMPLGIVLMVLAVILFIVTCTAIRSEVAAIFMLFFALLSFVGGIVFFVVDQFCRRNLLKIEFAGGCIAFKANLYSASDCANFQKQLSLAKDNAVEEAENATANAMRSAVQSIQPVVQQPVVQQPASGGADELMKYAQLLEKGLMTEAEFAEIKAKILSNK